MNVPVGFDAASSASSKPESLIDGVGALGGFVALWLWSHHDRVRLLGATHKSGVI